MFVHQHPYEPFIPENATKLIVGTLPPPRFSLGEFKSGDVDFCYGSNDGLLWPVLDDIFELKLIYETTQEAIDQRKQFLESRGIGICDIVQSCVREKIDASDLGMKQVVLRNLLAYLKKHPNIETLIFTGGNSKNGPEYFFRKHIKDYGIRLKLITDVIPREHEFILNDTFPNAINRIIKTVSLTAPSGSANRAIGSMRLYKQLKQQGKSFNTFKFRVMQYAPYF
ncbi:uracil-DNA glycosylase family protein [Mangrovimonas aestuarii]|uniref:uracil-DNA glycosylase family protein n=1 Tax=Mangrovimonas aestuarii TaxID=3018443 RepID=UPI002379306C|nr:uracil-DNA glycosylase family protein [Mangrovimonas aestuarii]